MLFVTRGYRSAGRLLNDELVDLSLDMAKSRYIVKASAREASTCPSLLLNPCGKITPLMKHFLRLSPPVTFSSQVSEGEGCLLALRLLILLLNEIIALSETARSKWHRKDLGCGLAAADNARVA